MSKKKLLIVCPVVIILLLFVSFFIYVNDYYHASKDALRFLENTNTVNIINIDDGYFFDGEGTDRAIIFYPGAKVEIESYVPFLRKLANYGIDCFLIDMPFKIAFLGTNKADNIINNYDYKSYTLMGHSLGGVAATSYVINNSKKIDSIIYLASYPNKKLPDDIYMLSVYGSNDKVLSMDAYNKNK